MTRAGASMKAAVCREFAAPLRIEEVTLDPPAAGEVTVRMAACAICHSDITYMRGRLGRHPARPSTATRRRASSRMVGAGVTDVQPGDHVVVTLIRSCGACHYCARRASRCSARQLSASTPQGPIHAGDGDADPPGDAHRRLRRAGDRRTSRRWSRSLGTCRSTSASLLACGVITGLGAVLNTAQVPAGSKSS